MCPYNGALFSVIGCDLLVVRTNFVVYTVRAAVYRCRPQGVTLWITLRTQSRMDVSIHYNLAEWSQSKLDNRESQDMLSWESLNLLDTGSCDSCLVPLSTWLHLELTNTCKGFFLLVKFLKVWRPSFIVDLLRWEDPSLIWAAYIKTQKKEAFSLFACLLGSALTGKSIPSPTSEPPSSGFWRAAETSGLADWATVGFLGYRLLN